MATPPDSEQSKGLLELATASHQHKVKQQNNQATGQQCQKRIAAPGCAEKRVLSFWVLSPLDFLRQVFADDAARANQKDDDEHDKGEGILKFGHPGKILGARKNRRGEVL